MHDFDWPREGTLPSSIERIRLINDVQFSNTFFNEMMDRLAKSIKESIAALD